MPILISLLLRAGNGAGQDVRGSQEILVPDDAPIVNTVVTLKAELLRQSRKEFNPVVTLNGVWRV